MQGGQGPGRGIYVTRRVVAALVVLLLIILFIPWACQNLLGPGEQSGSETSETDEADSSDDGGEEAARDEEVDTGEEAAKDEDSGAERGDTARELDSEAGSEDDEADSGDEEDGGGGGASNIELDTLGFVPGFEAVGGVDQAPPTLGFGVANQQNIQPAAPAAAPAEPVSLPVPAAPAGPPVAAEPIIPAEPVVPVEQVFFEDPFLFQDPLLFDDAAFFQEPVASEEPVVLEEMAPQDAGPISIASATNVEVERRGDRGRGGNNRRDIDRGSRDDGRDLGPR